MDTNKNEEKKGFTLIELLVVIAILSVLAVAVTVVINPAELIAQGRDSTRMSDLAALQSAVSLFLADQTSPSFSSIVNCTSPNGTATASDSSATSCSGNNATSTSVDGTGWVDVDFTSISSGSPLSSLPVDPVNDDIFFYVWISNTSEEYELNANMESNEFSTGGSEDVESNSEDGGDNDGWYEIGNAPDLNL